MEQERPKLTFKKATVPIKHSDGSYGFEEKWVWELYIPAGCNEQEMNDLLKSFKKGTKPMTLKDELTKLYKESDVAKKRSFIDKELPDRLREIAKKGYNCYTIAVAELEINHLGVSDMMQWCLDNGFKFYTENTLAGRYISIYWLVDRE